MPVETGGGDPSWARRTTADVHLWCGRPGLALAQLAAEEAELADGGSDAVEALSKAYRVTGRWARARSAALTAYEADEAGGLQLLALAVGGAEGAAAARPLWRRAVHLARGSDEPSPWHDYLYVLIAAGLADWTALDARLARLLALAEAPTTHWADLAELADDLTALLHAPGADRARLGPRLARVIAARDAVRARYAGPQPQPQPQPPLSEPESAPELPRPEAQG
ncbi:hypothetical protein [Streptomyces flavofungini]|uniref:Uncharacterized protein n=1 Tax=Streptomyces flavofungini TaxID=68200 RepID=A0ABS0X0J4_9ACTN|nr:hypothetical protein [Streptomyces flavofungini]MBJ3806694.1 hypothetical protein [Streptomyces flavofungini]